MYYYAQLNNDKICIGISCLTGEVDNPDMIGIDSQNNDLLFRKYQEAGTWSEEKFLPDSPLTKLSEFEQLQQDMGSLLLESANDKAKIASLESTTGDLLLEVANLKLGGNA